MDLMRFIWDVGFGIYELGTTLYLWLFEEIKIAGNVYTVWQLIAGVGITALIVMSILKRLIPFL